MIGLRSGIRRARPGDSGAICAVHKASVQGLCATAYSPDQIEAWIGPRVPEDYRRAMSSGETMFVAERGGRVVGFASLREDRLLALYVDPESGRGTGTPLLLTAEDHARSLGVEALHLNATPTAVSFYLKHGYEIVGSAAEQRGGIALPVVAMRKGLHDRPAPIL